MKKKTKSTIAFIVVLALAVATVAIAYFGVGDSGKLGVDGIRLGLDLKGGVNIVYEADVDTEPSQNEMNAAIEMIRVRLDREGYTEADVAQEGTKRIRVDIPGVEDATEAVEQIGATAKLTFVGPDDEVAVDGSHVKSATKQIYQDQRTGLTKTVVSLEFDSEGTKLFADATEKYLNQPLAIVLDGEAISAPTINSVISDGKAMIEGNFTSETADILAGRIEAGSLPFDLKAISSKGVGAKLGIDALDTSLFAAMIGIAFILIFMLVVYRAGGLAADIALLFYITLLIIVLSAMEATLTLPGVAGIILSIGMAVDANVIIMARIKEELDRGRSVRVAVDVAFDKALSAILDGNITTLIASGVLYYLGSGLIKSFAQTLAIGIIISMFTAIFLTKLIMKMLINMGINNPALYGASKEGKKDSKAIKFVEKRKVKYIISSIFIVIGLLAMPFNAFSGNEILNYDIEFKGGTLMHVDIGQDFDIDKDIRPIVIETTGDSAPHITKVVGEDEVIIKVTETTTEQRKDLFDKLKETYNLEDTDQLEVGDVSPTVSGEMKSKAIQAILISVVLMLIYITIRFKDLYMGASAVLALMHDVLLVFLIYSVFRVPVNNSFIAVMLTILGYSINDTIVIFDRVRENRGSTKLKDKDIINTSINQSLSRTINTSITTLSVVLLLFIFGTSAVREFALPLVVGIAVGTYSSIFLAGPLWYDLNRLAKNKKKKPAKKTA
ncbi:MAG: protein translocase subunit SecD [Epulopiscium sp.]|nr:protein translocase subunit SecD [Candidatus Epulonipiscium sp.]